MKKFDGIVYFYGIWVALLVVLPLLILVLLSFTNGDIYDLSSLTLTLDNYKAALDPSYIGVMMHSLLLALITNVICFVIGYPVAYIITGLNPRIRNTMVLLILAPMWSNFLLRTYSWMLVLGNNGPINSALKAVGLGTVQLMYNNFGVILGMVYNFLPFMILPIYLSLTRIDGALVEAARDLGATSKDVFFKVKLPLSMPGVFSGTTLVFLPAITTFVISRLLGGGQYVLIGNLIEHKFLVQNDWQVGAAIAVIVAIILLVILGVLRKLARGRLELSLW